MQTKKKPGSGIAQQYKAILPAQLALARWTRGGNLPHIAATARLPAQRAAWYDQLQHDLLAWFTAGGFHAPVAGVDAEVAPERAQSAVPK